jgi:hypothetical protein
VRSHAKAPSAGSTESSGVRSRRRLALALLLAGLLSALIGASQASARDVYVNEGTFAKDLSEPGKIAVDDATGNVLAVDIGNRQVQVWSSGGIASTHLLDFGAGLSSPYGIAVDQSNGDVYISNAGVDETQKITITGAEGGTFKLSFSGQTTAPIAYGDPDGSATQAALEALPNIGTGNVAVNGASTPGFSSTYTVTFQGTLAQTDVAQMSADDGGLIDEAGKTATATVETASVAGTDKIVRYQPDNRATPTAYTADPSFTSPVKGSDATVGQIGNFAAGLSVDPATGDLLVADDGNKYVERFDSSGAFLSSFNGSSTPGGPFQNLLDVVVGGGVTYVVDATGTFDPNTVSMSGVSRVVQFDSTGSSLGILEGAPPLDFGMERARDIAYDPASGSVFVGEQRASLSALHVYRDDNPYQRLELTSENDYAGFAGLAADSGSPGASGRVYASLGITVLTGLGIGIHVFDRLQFPDVTIASPTNITGNSMHLFGTVAPINGEATYHFKYCLKGGSGCAETTAGKVSSAEGVEADITGLQANTTYEITLLATNDDGTTSSDPKTATTLATVPVVVTGSASNLSAEGAILHGTVNPLGAQSGYHFEYGTTTHYGSQSPLGHDVVVGKGQVPVVASQQIFGLQPATTYHYRLVAQNSAGSDAGEDRTFTTLPLTAVPQRSYELVSPAAKGGNNVKAELGFQASADGNAFSFLGTTVLGGLSESAPFLPRYASRRSAADWSTAPTDPAQIPGPNQPLRLTFGVSDDGTKALGMSLKKLAPGAVDGEVNIYLHDLLSGTYTTIGSTPEVWWLVPETGPGGGGMFVQGTPNFDHILFKAVPPLLPGAPYEALYDFTGGQLHLVSRAPDGTPIAGRANTEHGKNAISADGSRIAFESTETGGIYLRWRGTTKPISESRRSSDPPGTLMPATLIGGDRDLKHIYFFSKDLTDSSDPGLRSLYRYEVESDELEFLTWVDDKKSAESPSPAVALQVSDDGSGVYFTSSMALTPDAVAGAPNTYVLRNGDLSLVLSSDGFDLPGTGISRWWASPNGRYFAFRSATQNLTGYDAKNPACGGSGTNEYGACAQIYRYDTETDEIVCASCRPDGKMPVASAYLGPGGADVGTHSWLRATTDRGQVFFSTPEQLVPEDTNSYSDVYEYDDLSGPRLLSDGSGTGSQIAEVSVDGSDVFFTTKDRLVGVDTDTATDVYDARVEGGLASQNPPPSREECIRDDCKAVPNGGPELPFGGSEALSGPENVKEAGKKRCGKGRHARKVKGKQRCVKQKKGKQNRANDNRRQGR